MSNTYMIGEKYIDPGHNNDGQAISDDEGAFMGFNAT